MQLFALVFRYGALLILGMCIGCGAAGQAAVHEVLLSSAFAVIVIGGLSKGIEKLCGIAYPKFLDTPGKKRLGELAVLVLGLVAGLGMGL